MNNHKTLFVFNDKIGFVSLVDQSITDVGLKIANSARISYDNIKQNFDPNKDSKLIKFLWKNNHTSPFRHSWFTFHIKAPLFVFRQWIKYQVGSYWMSIEHESNALRLDITELIFDLENGCSWNEISGRYVELSNEMYFPSKIRSNTSHGNKQASYQADWTEEQHISNINLMQESARSSYEAYKALIKNGVARELARIILPQNVYTEAYWTVSLHSILHFLSQRLKQDAQYEIRMYAESIYSILSDKFDLIQVTKEDIINL